MSEGARLRRAFDAIPKIAGHGELFEDRHQDVLPEWIVQIISDPYDQYEEYDDGELRTILVGRVPQSRQWIEVVFVGDPATGALLTAYKDRRLAHRYGGRPWLNQE